MYKHLIIVILTFAYLGVGVSISQLGIQNHINLWVVIGIYTTSIILVIVVSATSLRKLKEFIEKNEK